MTEFEKPCGCLLEWDGREWGSWNLKRICRECAAKQALVDPRQRVPDSAMSSTG